MSTALWIALLLAAPPEAGVPADARADAQADAQAKALARRSMLDYDTGHYAQALAEVEKAYELDPLPALLFNLGQCHRALGHHRDAAMAFRSYLRDVPNAKNRELAQTLYEQMSVLAAEDEKGAATAPPPPAPVPAAAPAAPPPPSPLPPVPEASVTASQGGGHIRAGAWWLGGAGLAVGVVGTILFGLAESTLGGDHPVTLSNGTVGHQLPSGSFFAAATRANLGEVLWCVGGALLVAGGVVAFTGSSK
jgi:hypothetical protein